MEFFLNNLKIHKYSGNWWLQVLMISKCMHDLQTCLFIYIAVSAFCIKFLMLSMVKMLLKG